MFDKNKQFENLMIDYLSGTISDDGEKILLDLLNSNPKYKSKYSEMAKLRAISFVPALEKEKASNYSHFKHLINNVYPFNWKLDFLNSFSRVAVIAFIMISASIVSFFMLKNGILVGERLTTCETVVPLGSQAKIILPDSSVAWLNSGSTLKYNNHYGKKDRKVILTGEGYFEVRKNKRVPFYVNANKIKVKVLGTTFNVRSYLNDPTVEVDLLTGKVDVSTIGVGKSKKLTLVPNEKMVYDKKSNVMTSCKTDAAKSAQWTIGKLCFVDASIEYIAGFLERKYDVQIKLEKESIKNEIFSGSLNLNLPINKVLDYLDVDNKFKITYAGKKIIIN